MKWTIKLARLRMVGGMYIASICKILNSDESMYYFVNNPEHKRKAYRVQLSSLHTKRRCRSPPSPSPSFDVVV